MNSKTFLIISKIFFISIFFFLCNNANCQIWNKIKNGAKDIKDAAKGVQDATKQVTNTSNEVSNSIKTLKKSWKRDTSSNIKYYQVPDYRVVEDVSLSKKQKLAIENGQFKNISWEPVTKFDNQIFPSFVIGWSNYTGVKDEDIGSSLGFNISTNLSNAVLKWEIESDDKNYFTTDSGYINCDYIRNTHLFMPKLAWNYRALTNHPSNSPLNISFRLIDPITGNKVEKKVTISLRSINDCLLSYAGKPYNYLFVSYVNEDHPEIDKILKKMLDTKMIDNVLGYQWGEEFLELQIAALWRVLHEMGFKYSSITDNSGYNDMTGKGIFSQTVRTFDNSLQTNQANCVDGTVFIASILKKMGIRPILINVPKHCFLGYYTNDSTKTDIRFLETTLMSDHSYLDNPKVSVAKYNTILAKQIPKEVKLSELNKAYYLEFLSATAEGMNKYDKNVKTYGSANIKFIDVSTERKYIKPIPKYN